MRAFLRAFGLLAAYATVTFASTMVSPVLASVIRPLTLVVCAEVEDPARVTSKTRRARNKGFITR